MIGMPARFTPRGFAMYAEFPHQDYPESMPQSVTVQESSLATERKVWVGEDGNRLHLNEEEARIIRDALTEFLGDDPIVMFSDIQKAIQEAEVPQLEVKPYVDEEAEVEPDEEAEEDLQLWCPACNSYILDGSGLYAVDIAERWTEGSPQPDRKRATFYSDGGADYGDTLYYRHDTTSPHAVRLPAGWTESWR